MEPMTFTLPYPPSVNHYKSVGQLVRTKSGKLYQKRFNSPETTAFYYKVWQAIRFKAPLRPLESTISLEVSVYPPDKRKRDLDGILKVLMDSLQRGGLILDDYQVARLLVIRRDIIPGGQVIVQLSEIENELTSG